MIVYYQQLYKVMWCGVKAMPRFQERERLIWLLTSRCVSCRKYGRNKKMTEKITKSNLKNGEILVGFRKQNKITQATLGKMIGLDCRDISKYEKGYRAIPQEAVDYLNSEYNLKLKPTGKVVKYKIEGKGLKVAKKDKSFRKSTSKISTFGKRITALRESLSLSQIAFATKFGFKPSSLSRIESDSTSNVDVKALKALHKAGFNIVDLIK